jgi:hypothetical protein
MSVTARAFNPEIQMNLSYFLQKAAVGIAGMTIGRSLITLVRVAAVAGAENARLQHVADIASGRKPVSRDVVRSDLLRPNLAASGVLAAK